MAQPDASTNAIKSSDSSITTSITPLLAPSTDSDAGVTIDGAAGPSNYGAAAADFDTQSKHSGDESGEFSSAGYDDGDDEEYAPSILQRAKKFSQRRFWWFCSLGILFIVIFELSFLPRTSLSRDFRRWYNLHLTKNDISRNFLILSGVGHAFDNVTNEESLKFWLGNFTKLNSQSSVNLCADDNYELASYVESNFKKLRGFKTTRYSYEVPSLLEPQASSLKLVDDKDAVLYDAKLFEENFKTPAYYSLNNFGEDSSSEVSGSYIFVNEGRKEDYDLLLKNDVDPAGKIVIVKNNGVNLTVGEKVTIARAYGAIGYIMYKEPLSKNGKKDKKYDVSIERGSLWDAKPGPEDKASLPAIPISYKSVLPILKTFGDSSETTFSNWTYHPVPSSPTLFLRLETDFSDGEKPRKVTNIISKIEGILNDGEVVVGVSRDSFTSSNPLSGHAIMLEIMKGFERLMKLGWRPFRPVKFVSWDGTHNGLLGSTHYLNDSNAYDSKLPVVAYINLDGDAIMGSQFSVDGNPSLMHLLKSVSKYVPIPTESTYYKTLVDGSKDVEEEAEEEEGDGEIYSNTESTSLYHYWKKQDNNTINTFLGDSIKTGDALNFQEHLGVPVVNVKFKNDPKRDTSIYIPNSNYYNYDWVVNREIDNDMILHGSLVRYLGLLTISFIEKEVVDRKFFPYIKSIQEFFTEQVTTKLAKFGDAWLNQEIPLFLINNRDIYNDMSPVPLPNKPILFQNLLVQFNILIDSLIDQSKVYDEYNRYVGKNLIKDYAWYHSFMKIKHYAQFKLANYKLLRLEQELLLSVKGDDYKFLNIDAQATTTDAGKSLSSSLTSSKELWYKHIIYGLSKFDVNSSSSNYYNRNENCVFPGLQTSLQSEDFDQTLRWLIVTYGKLKGVLNKMT